MKNAGIFVLVIAALASSSFGQQKVFGWVRANDEVLRLDPGLYETGRVYHPGSGGNIQVDIEAQQPVTIAMTWLPEWKAALQQPESASNLKYRCLREHVVRTTYVCELPPSPTPMVLVIHDERNLGRAIVAGLGAVLRVHGAGRDFVAPNDVQITYYRWACMDNCNRPEYRWVRLLKEKYELTTIPKVYGLFTPERDGQQLSVKIKAPVPMTIAVVPSPAADQVFAKPDTLEPALANSSCKQRGVQSLSFECTFKLADGPQSLVLLPSTPTVPARKKAEIELQAVKCVANCAPPPTN